jgi:hypothetical protein
MLVKMPQYAGRQFYDRRKEAYLAEDVFVFGFSAVNGLPDKRLSKCLKPALDLDDTHISVLDEDTQETHDINSLVELCVTLQEKVNSLETIVKDQNKRIATLEVQNTCTKINNMVILTHDPWTRPRGEWLVNLRRLIGRSRGIWRLPRSLVTIRN